MLLLRTRKLVDLLKKLPGFPCRAAPSLLLVFAEKVFDSHVQGFSQLCNLLWSQRDGLTLPRSVTGLIYAELCGYFGLGEAERFPRSMEFCAERIIPVVAWSTCSHAPIIPALK